MSKPPSPRAIERAVSLAMQLREWLGDDQGGYVISLDSETDALDILDRIIERSTADRELAKRARERAQRLEARADKARDTALQIMEALQIGRTEPLQRATYTASISQRSKAIVTDAEALPASLIRHAPDMLAIARALRDGPVPGAEQSNPQPVLTVQTK